MIVALGAGSGGTPNVKSLQVVLSVLCDPLSGLLLLVRLGTGLKFNGVAVGT